MSYFSIFSVDKRDILNYPIDYYHNLINETNYHDNPETGHYLERCWANLFNPKFTIIRKDNFLHHICSSIKQTYTILN
jgi:hypothetical protein